MNAKSSVSTAHRIYAHHKINSHLSQNILKQLITDIYRKKYMFVSQGYSSLRKKYIHCFKIIIN